MRVTDDEWTRRDGAPWPLGVTWVAEDAAFNFALYSKDATAVTLLLYNTSDFQTPLVELAFVPPRNRTGRVWHRRVPLASIPGAKYYAYRVEGAATPASGARFDGLKILLDPYAKSVFFPPGFSREAACVPGSNAGKAPLGLLPPSSAEAKSVRTPALRHGHDLVIYEMHVRGFTKRANSAVPDAARGTYAGVVHKIPYLKQLGITAVELLPVQQFDPSEGSYWGYMTLNFFSPHYQYSSGGNPESALAEFKSMVDAFHDAGIEVFLDVVYNHTTEQGVGGPTFSYKGIDNATYYALDPNNMASYANHSGCGNDLRTAHPVVRRLVVDSLRYWVKHTNVDGFRFDLASVFAFNEDGSLNLKDPPIIAEITSDPDLADVRLIAEPWSGDGSAYLMGRTFPGKTWHQWNDHARDTFRGFVKSDGSLVADLMRRLYGSTDLFPDDLTASCRRWQSVNFVDCHDGFNMCDLVSYTNDQYRAWNCGYEGADGVPADVAQLRRRQIKNFCCLLMLSNGVPMFVAGDEFMHTQRGDGNPYNQDNEITWLDWSLADRNAELLRFFRMMIGVRKAHPSIGRDTGWGDDVTWYGAVSAPDLADYSRSLAFHLTGSSVGDVDFYVMINAYWEPVDFSIQRQADWRCLVDTSAPSPTDIMEEDQASEIRDARYRVGPRSVVVLFSGPRQAATSN